MRNAAAWMGMVCVLCGFLMACGQAPAVESEEAVQSVAPSVIGTYADNPVKRGQYLVRMASCNDCHTPWIFDEELHMPRPDMTHMLSGHPKDAPDPMGTLGQTDMALIGPTFTSFALPFGVVYSANLTPDPESGIGT